MLLRSGVLTCLQQKEPPSHPWPTGPPVQPRLRCPRSNLPLLFSFYTFTLFRISSFFCIVFLHLLGLHLNTITQSSEISGVTHSGRSHTPTFALLRPGTRIPCFPISRLPTNISLTNSKKKKGWTDRQTRAGREAGCRQTRRDRARGFPSRDDTTVSFQRLYFMYVS